MEKQRCSFRIHFVSLSNTIMNWSFCHICKINNFATKNIDVFVCTLAGTLHHHSLGDRKHMVPSLGLCNKTSLMSKDWSGASLNTNICRSFTNITFTSICSKAQKRSFWIYTYMYNIIVYFDNTYIMTIKGQMDKWSNVTRNDRIAHYLIFLSDLLNGAY